MDRIERFGLYVLFALLLFMVAVVAYGSVDCDDISVGCGDYYSKPFDSEGQARRFARLVILSCGKVSSVSVVSGITAIRHVERSGECPVGSFDADRWYLEMSISQASTPPPPPEPTPTQSTQSTPTQSTSTPTSTPPTETVMDEVKEAEPTIPDDIEIKTDKPVSSPVKESHTYRINKGWNFLVFSVVPNDVETLADLYPHLYHDPILIVNIDNSWLTYEGEGETGEIPLTPNLGVALYSETDFAVTMYGYRFKTPTSLTIEAGLSFVGFPMMPVERPSDFLAEEGEEGVLAVLREIDGVLYLIGRSNDAGDDLLFDGEAVMLISTEQLTLKLSPSVSAAPAAQRRGTLVTSWGAMKR